MTYLQLMLKCLNFFNNEKEKFDWFYYQWFGPTASEDDNTDLQYKSKVQKAIVYLKLLETKKDNNTQNKLLNFIEKNLSYFDIGLCTTLEQAEEKAINSIAEDPYLFEQICLLEQGELTEEQQNEIISVLVNETRKQKSYEWEIKKYESAIHTVMELVSQIIPELFFTERGYKYIDKEYQIDDINLREKCYEYLQKNIDYYNVERIYKVDENIYSQFYEYDNESDEFKDSYDENVYIDDDQLRGQVDIYGEDIDNYDLLYYSITLLTVILRFVQNKEYDKIEKLIRLDEEMTNFYGTHGDYCDKTLIETLYQPKTIDNDYHKEISTPSKSDFFLDFFLSNNEFTKRYNVRQLSLIINYCFDIFDSESINKIYKNIDIINEIINDILPTDNIAYLNKSFEEIMSDSKNYEEKIKKLIKIKKAKN